VQPVHFLFTFGTGLSALAGHGRSPGVGCGTFIYPGVRSRSVAFTAIFAAASIAWDREFGFPREMLVAQVKVGDRLSGNASAARRFPRFSESSFWHWPGLRMCRETLFLSAR